MNIRLCRRPIHACDACIIDRIYKCECAQTTYTQHKCLHANFIRNTERSRNGAHTERPSSSSSSPVYNATCAAHTNTHTPTRYADTSRRSAKCLHVCVALYSILYIVFCIRNILRYIYANACPQMWRTLYIWTLEPSPYAMCMVSR